MVFIYRQELLNDIAIFTSQPKQKFYSDLFLSLNLDCLPLHNCIVGRKGATNHAFVCSFIVMKCEGFAQISDLHDYLTNNLIIAHYCGFNIHKPLPSYASFTRFIRDFDNDVLQLIMQNAVLKARSLGLIDTSFIAIDSTPVKANVCNNNPKSFSSNKFTNGKQPKADKDCRLGVQTASNRSNEKKVDFYWGYKNHIVVDCISGLPIYEITTGANIADSTVCIDSLKKVHAFMSLDEFYLLADKAYDVKAIYNTVKNLYNGECYIPINPRNTKNPQKLPDGRPICEAGLAMHRDGICRDNGRSRQKFCCPFKRKKNAVCPINHKAFKNTGKATGCSKYITIPDDYRLSIDRDSIAFKSIYALRTEAERYNSRFKSAGCERVFVRNINSVKNLNTIAHISLLAIAIATVSLKKPVSYRSTKAVKRIA